MERQAALLLGLSTGTRAAQELHQRPREQPDTPARNSRTKGRVRTVCLGRLPFPAILANAQSSDAYKAACSLSSPAGAVTGVRAGSGEGCRLAQIVAEEEGPALDSILVRTSPVAPHPRCQRRNGTASGKLPA